MRSTRTKLAEKCKTAVEDATKDLITRYRYEVRQRKLLYNQLQELKGNIRVFCRVRHDDRVTCALEFPDKTGLHQPTHTRAHASVTQQVLFLYDPSKCIQSSRAAVSCRIQA